MKRPDSLPALVNVLMSSQDEGIRQMSATMLRQRITKSWMRVGADVKGVVKQSLITSVTNDPSYVYLLSARLSRISFLGIPVACRFLGSE